jgi:hypothetical protein
MHLARSDKRNASAEYAAPYHFALPCSLAAEIIHRWAPVMCVVSVKGYIFKTRWSLSLGDELPFLVPLPLP